jgi:tetratricopeptide (TPR) repeat protein
MNNEIRKAVRLSPELEDQTFEMQGDAIELLADGKNEAAEATIKAAWELLPEPKFNTSCSHTILCDYIEILTQIGKHEEAKTLLLAWINDLETSGYQVYETMPFILLGETFMYLNEIDQAKAQFNQAVKYGATKRDFSDKPNFYFEIAKKKLTANNEIAIFFDHEVRNQARPNTATITLTDEASEQIEDLSEQGNTYFDEEHYSTAIEVWQQALALIPHPQNTYAESQWLETSIGDAYFLNEEFELALQHFQNAKSNIEAFAYENPFIMLRLGQSLLECTQPEEAKEYLLRAYLLEGEEIFDNDDPKYLDFLKQQVDLTSPDEQ